MRLPAWTRRIDAQLAVLVVGCFLAWQLVTAVAILILDRPGIVQRLREGPGALAWFAAEVKTAAGVVERAPPEIRTAVVAALAASNPRFLPDPPEAPPAMVADLPLADAMFAEVRGNLADRGTVVTLVRLEGDDYAVDVAVGETRFRIVGPPGLNELPVYIVFSWLTVGGLTVAALVVWAGRSLTAPLKRLASSVETQDLAAPFTPAGPVEVRTLALAIARLRERIADLLEARTRMLVAVSHDLRTPLSRLSFHAERIDDPAVRDAVRREIGGMAKLIGAALDHLRGHLEQEPAVAFDLAALLQTAADQFADTGATVSYEGPARFAFTGRPAALGRAVENLVANGLKHGSAVEIRLLPGNPAVVTVADDGPGIPRESRDAVIEPFVTGEAARTGGTGGFGLGLSIVRDVVTEAGGTLELADAEPHGLLVRLTLPVRMHDQAAG